LLPNYNLGIMEIESSFLLLVVNAILSYVLLITRAYYIIGTLEFLRGILFVICFFALTLTLKLDAGYQYLIKAAISLNVLLLLWQFWCIRRHTPMFSPFHVLRTRQGSDYGEKGRFYLYSTLSTIEYSSALVYVYLSSLIILSAYTQEQLADFQVVARPIYLALISIFSYPVFRFLFPEFSLKFANFDIEEIEHTRRRFIRICILFGFTVVLGSWLFSERILGFLFPVEYIGAVDMLNILVVALPFSVYTSFSFALIKAAGGFKYTVTICLIGVGCFFGSLYLFRLWAGVHSVVYAMLMNVLVMFTGSICVERYLLADLFLQKAKASPSAS
jgi:O-antigen/teichoic acid export membrane protein